MRNSLRALRHGFVTLLPMPDAHGRPILYFRKKKIEQNPTTDEVRCFGFGGAFDRSSALVQTSSNSIGALSLVRFSFGQKCDRIVTVT